MGSLIESAERTLRQFAARRESGSSGEVDRAEVVAHATLSALLHHWPSRAQPEMMRILEATSEIKARERSRWMTQRRIAIAKLASLLP